MLAACLHALPPTPPPTCRPMMTLSTLRQPMWSNCSRFTPWHPPRCVLVTVWCLARLSLAIDPLFQVAPACLLLMPARPPARLPACLPSPQLLQEVFTFEHPNRAHHIDNTRSIKMEFECTPPGGSGKPRHCGACPAVWLLGCPAACLPGFSLPGLAQTGQRDAATGRHA